MKATKSREVIWGRRIRAANLNAEYARKRAVEAVREADHAEAEGVVSPDGGLWWAGSALSNDRPMPQ